MIKDKIKFEDWKCVERHLKGKDEYLFKFDLKNRYHHFDYFESHRKVLGFSRVIKGKISFLFSKFYHLG